TLAGPAGRVPNLGDDDGGRVLGLAGTASRDARRVLALGAALTGHEAAGRRGGQAEPEDVLWLLGSSALAALPERDEGRAGAPAHLRAGGLVVLGRGEDHVAVDVGAIGFRGRGGHGHLDAMSFEATLGGRLAVRDSGTASYTGDPGLRNRLRDAPAHSVVLVDGRRYARIGGEEALWSVEGDAPPEGVSVEGDRESQKATVVQRLPAAGGVALHERTIEWRPGHVRMLDRLEAPEGAAVSAFLHLPAGCEPTAAGFRGGHHDYAAHPPEGASMTAEPHPWSEAYGTVGEGLRVTLEFRASGEFVEWSWDVRAR
ncbi:MAG: heparinase II/III domain-containing protein, partial [Solirubrobacteraceae bacterium]